MTEDFSADIDAWLSTDEDGDAAAAPFELAVVSDLVVVSEPDVVSGPAIVSESATVPEPAVFEPAGMFEPIVVFEPADVSEPAIVSESAAVPEPSVFEPAGMFEPIVMFEPAAVFEPAVVSESAAVFEPDVFEAAVVLEAAVVSEPDVVFELEVVSEPEVVFEPAAAPLDPPRPTPGSLLEAIAALPGAADEEAGPAAPVPAPTRAVPRYVLFSVAGAHYAVPQPHVTELDRVPAFTVVPNVPAWVRGITNRRGDILSVVDTRALLGIERLAAGSGRMLVVRLLDDSCSLGLLVDEVHQIVSVPPSDVRDPGPGLDGPLAPFLAGLIELDQRTVAVLDLEGFLRSPLLRQFDEPADAAALGHH